MHEQRIIISLLVMAVILAVVVEIGVVAEAANFAVVVADPPVVVRQ